MPWNQPGVTADIVFRWHRTLKEIKQNMTAKPTCLQLLEFLFSGFFKDVIRFYETELSIHKPKTLAPKNFRDFLKNVFCCPYSVLV